jgi:predicted O-methyltransferase YrrM
MTTFRFPSLPEGASITTQEAALIASHCPKGGLLVETGTYKGLGTSRLLHVLPEGADLISIEVFPDLLEQARAFLPEDPALTLVLADSSQWTPPRPIDVLILDCFPRREAYESLKPHLADGAAVFVHDMNKPGPNAVFNDLDVELLETPNALGRVL